MARNYAQATLSHADAIGLRYRVQRRVKQTQSMGSLTQRVIVDSTQDCVRLQRFVRDQSGQTWQRFVRYMSTAQRIVM